MPSSSLSSSRTGSRTSSGTRENTISGSITTRAVVDLPIQLEQPPPSSSLSTLRVSHRWLLENEISEKALIQKIAAKLKPAVLQVINAEGDENRSANIASSSSSLPKLKPHQFLHLHHMKTGGTSIDHMMRCAMDRLQGKRGMYSHLNSNTASSSTWEKNNGNDDKNTSGQLYSVPYFNIHECSRAQFSNCLGNSNDSCRASMKDAAVMSYCAGLKYLNEFGWNEWGLAGENNNERHLEEDENDEDDDDVDQDMEDNQFIPSQDNDDPTGENGLVEANRYNNASNINKTTTDSSTTTTTSSSSSSNSNNDHLPMDRIRAFTVLRHPVDRVWSMFRFQTRNCYQCLPLLDIYHRIDTNTTTYTLEDGTIHPFDDLCLNQLLNHQVANMLTSSHWPASSSHFDDDDEATQTAMVTEAISNMKKYFTVVGLSEELEETRRILGKVFPWMNETLHGYMTTTCPLPHDNSSPANNRCIKNNKGQDSHWDLPKHPDEETRQAIEAHNTMDIMLYEAAVDYFELQKRALDWGEEEL
jgi:hypothetical protein